MLLESRTQNLMQLSKKIHNAYTNISPLMQKQKNVDYSTAEKMDCV